MTHVSCKKKTIISEGVIDKIIEFVKELFKKAIALLVKIWKAIVSFAKKVWESVTNFISKIIGGSHDKERQIKLKVAFITENFKATEKEYHSKEDIANAYKAAIAKINAEIQKRSNENINFMKRFENNANTVIRKEALEYVEEKVLTRNTSTRNSITRHTYRMAEERRKRDDSDFQLAKNADNLVTVDGVIQGKTRADHISEFDMKMYDKESLEIIKKSKNVIEAYYEFTSNKIEHIVSKFMKYQENAKTDEEFTENMKKEGLSGATYICQLILDAQALYALGYNEIEVGNFLIGTYFPDFDDVDDEKRQKAIRHWVNLKLNQNKTIISCLRNMILLNTSLLEISQKTATNIAADLDKGDVESSKEVISKNLDKFMKKDGMIFDGRSIGLGCIVFSKEVAKGDDVTEVGWYRAFLNNGEKVSDHAIKQLTRYGVTVVSHGDFEHKRWTMQAVYTPGGKGPFTDMEELLDALIKEGFKRINVMSCNPGGAKLPERFAKNNKVLIKYSTNNTLIS